jgi:xylulokinase
VTRIAVLDVGTTAVKAAVVDADGRVLAGAEAPLATSTPGPGRVEQRPGDWQAAALDVAAVWRDTEVDALAVTGQMQTLVLAGDDSALLYSDQRAAAEHAALTAELGPAWAHAVGAVPDATNLAAKWAWLLAHEPARADRAEAVLLGAPGELVRRFTGEVVVDPTTAATTGLLDVGTGRWWAPVLVAARLPEHLLPRVVAPTSSPASCARRGAGARPAARACRSCTPPATP